MENIAEIDRILTTGGLALIRDHAKSAYPSECCGLVRRSGVLKCRNFQDELHALDPVAHPRTSVNGFSLDAETEIQLMESFASDDPVLCVYHSHPDEPPRFSAADQAGAAPNGTANYPELTHLVVSCSHGVAREARLYRFDGERFVQAARYP